jgi:hypothetical protein
MKRTRFQRKAYAARRMSLAVDRVIRSENPAAARMWVNAWAAAAGIRRYVQAQGAKASRGL